MDRASTSGILIWELLQALSGKQEPSNCYSYCIRNASAGEAHLVRHDPSGALQRGTVSIEVVHAGFSGHWFQYSESGTGVGAGGGEGGGGLRSDEPDKRVGSQHQCNMGEVSTKNGCCRKNVAYLGGGGLAGGGLGGGGGEGGGFGGCGLGGGGGGGGGGGAGGGGLFAMGTKASVWSGIMARRMISSL